MLKPIRLHTISMSVQVHVYRPDPKLVHRLDIVGPRDAIPGIRLNYHDIMEEIEAGRETEQGMESRPCTCTQR